MLSEIDIDAIASMANDTTSPNPEIYYVANMIETREGIIDECHYKSNPKYKIIPVKVKSVLNAYFEYNSFLLNPNQYGYEEEEEYFDDSTHRVHQYIVKNSEKSSFTNRTPSIIFGVKHYDGSKDIIEESVVKPIYLAKRELKYGERSSTAVSSELSKGKLSWKYMKLDKPPTINGEVKEYVSSNYYILELENFHSLEKPLVNPNEKCSYFMNIKDAVSYMKELEA